MLRTLIVLLFALSCQLFASAQQAESDSLQQLLSHTVDPEQRTSLLLNIKDLNENSELNLPVSIQLFREAAITHNTYAMSVAVIPILLRYSNYAEKQDSLSYYIRTLHQMAPGTAEEGIEHFSELSVAYNKLGGQASTQETIRHAHAALTWCQQQEKPSENIYEQTKRLLIESYAKMLLAYYEQGDQLAYLTQIDNFQLVYKLTTQMTSLHIRRNFALPIYTLLSATYNQAHNYSALVALTKEYTTLLDNYSNQTRTQRQRPYLYLDNLYVFPYQQLIRGAINIGRKDYIKHHFDEMRTRMFKAKGQDLQRSKSFFYKTGYLTTALERDYTKSLHYVDSLFMLMSGGQNYDQASPRQIYNIHSDHSRILALAGRYDEALDAYEHTLYVLDSLFTAERAQRQATIARSHEMDLLKLSKTRSSIRIRVAINIAAVLIGLLVIGIGIYRQIAWRRNRLLQKEIQRHNLKAQESEHMKSTFVDTICRGIEPPFNALDGAAHKLMAAGVKAPERHQLLEVIHKSTETLLSTLDTMLEAANLDSLTDSLHFTAVDIDELCRAEVLIASRLHHSPDVAFSIEAPEELCRVHTHAQYFTMVVRALLDNAGKYTTKGTITLRYEQYPEQNELRLSVTDTGCGIPPERQANIFHSLCDHSTASHGLSLALCLLITERLAGSISLDSSYTHGARFLVTIPLKP